jgi:hypothetical protein
MQQSILENLDFRNKRVVDYGAGVGLLQMRHHLRERTAHHPCHCRIAQRERLCLGRALY